MQKKFKKKKHKLGHCISESEWPTVVMRGREGLGNNKELEADSGSKENERHRIGFDRGSHWRPGRWFWRNPSHVTEKVNLGERRRRRQLSFGLCEGKLYSRNSGLESGDESLDSVCLGPRSLKNYGKKKWFSGTWNMLIGFGERKSKNSFELRKRFVGHVITTSIVEWNAHSIRIEFLLCQNTMSSSSQHKGKCTWII